MAEMGLGQIARLELDRYDDTTVAALAVYSPPDPADGLRRRLGVNTLSEDHKRVWTGVVEPYDVGGLWYHIWTITGMGYGRIVHEVPVVPDRMADAVGFVYATTADLAAWMRDAPPADAERMLQAATHEIDDLLTTARYEVDADGYPAVGAQRRAVRDACCMLVEWWNETGDESGAAQFYGSMSAGSISVGRATAGNARAGAQTRVPARISRVLAAEGLLWHAPTVTG